MAAGPYFSFLVTFVTAVAAATCEYNTVLGQQTAQSEDCANLTLQIRGEILQLRTFTDFTSIDLKQFEQRLDQLTDMLQKQKRCEASFGKTLAPGTAETKLDSP